MKRYNTHDIAESGFYFNLRRLVFTSLRERGPLPGEDGETWTKVPALLMVPAGLLISVAYVIFLPVIGFVMLLAVLIEKIDHRRAERARAIDPSAPVDHGATHRLALRARRLLHGHLVSARGPA